jgi:hypothetical protein
VTPEVLAAVAALHDRGYAVLKHRFARPAIERARESVWPRLMAHIGAHEPNRGACRHFFPLPFDPACFTPDFFFDPEVLAVVAATIGDRVVADQWGCDVALHGSEHQGLHVDYRNPLFAEAPDLTVPAYMLVVSFGLVPITLDNGPIEIVPGTHRLTRADAARSAEAGDAGATPVPLDLGDVLIRHPWALHRGSPNTTATPRALASIRYVRRWYTDSSRDVAPLSRSVLDSLTPAQQAMMRFPLHD